MAAVITPVLLCRLGLVVITCVISEGNTRSGTHAFPVI
ncbi:hypothetical protein RIEGSTA812A_PEG_17 [invertebrate metagenome]|uniref:Uncharacterized protein n=1 Tax=invertebrate metagenome TaxID=1711999 RepID=A0A484H572_9ZZZZ